MYISEKNKLHVLKMVPYLHSKKLMNRSPHITYNQREVRMQEIIDSIQYTIEHPLVGSLYIFYQNISLISYIEKHNLKMKKKIIYVSNIEDTMSKVFNYADRNLRGQVVMVMNADVYPIEGFDKINYTHLQKNKLIYCISRYFFKFILFP